MSINFVGLGIFNCFIVRVSNYMNINDMQIRQPLVFWGYLEHCWTRV